MGLPTDQSANGSARGTAETGSYRKADRRDLGVILLNTFTSNPGMESESTLIKLASDTERFRASANSNWMSLKTGLIETG